MISIFKTLTSRRGSLAVVAAAILPLTFAGPLAASEEDGHGGVQEFHETMEELGEHTQRIVSAINHENWEWVAREAEAIAEHPRPPKEERQRIMAFAAERKAEFQEYDHEVHAAAAELSDIAAEGDGREVINAFARLQTTCLDCHANFRDDFRQHFYMDKDAH
ncbi:cytochrome c [Guyparkeria sp. 1SP6A2]|nr:cytochrome c [Guyparkeria sp. 1SP6A2]